jgi:hypothetical protein
MTDDQFEENAMERASFWKCLITVMWCIIDDAQSNAEKKKEEAAAATAKAIEAAELQAYVNQCECSY